MQLLDRQNMFQRLMLSGDGRILMCGNVLIQLNPELNQVHDIGVIMMEREFSLIRYKFLSLKSIESRKLI
jgi:hypothetical protein